MKYIDQALYHHKNTFSVDREQKCPSTTKNINTAFKLSKNNLSLYSFDTSSLLPRMYYRTFCRKKVKNYYAFLLKHSVKYRIGMFLRISPKSWYGTFMFPETQMEWND